MTVEEIAAKLRAEFTHRDAVAFGLVTAVRNDRKLSDREQLDEIDRIVLAMARIDDEWLESQRASAGTT